ncbi:NAD-dependent epimerase/dehydratase family protein [Pengzhenrongella frigida]|uniref:NAD-dependent epimerase/dehydratase family protein n=1 Tax=Pengzhenrongella frigida TaxID=1259133 RepID=A0A4Q5N6J2_9MICO|nr:NAD-dependent epimerase/dehydratase family protein [Cellulomonas sp. HLT2-17]RYV51881.1 NAD-dependent epimerase/dehydratase family protein [Cellulomonas sp. HLT2-17]
MAKHVVVGAGPVGTATARLLAERGEQVVLVTRSGSGPEHPAITRVAADASSSDRLTALADGGVALYNCANPQYHRWPTDWPPIAHALITAAERSNVVLATVSNLYAYGPVTGPMTEDLPLAPLGPKGRVRAQMWRDALAAHDAGHIRATEIRGSDYVGNGVSGHLGDRVVPRLLRGRDVTVVKSADTTHTWTAIDDVARLLVTAAADERAWGRPWHVPSNPPRTQREAIDDLSRVAGLHPVKVKEYSPLLLRAIGVVNPVMRELPEVAYQFEQPFVLDSTAAQETFGLVPTPWEAVLADVINWYRSRA